MNYLFSFLLILLFLVSTVVFAEEGSLERKSQDILCGQKLTVTDKLVERREFPIFSGEINRDGRHKYFVVFMNDIEKTFSVIESNGDEFCVTAHGRGRLIGFSPTAY